MPHNIHTIYSCRGIFVIIIFCKGCIQSNNWDKYLYTIENTNDVWLITVTTVSSREIEGIHFCLKTEWIFTLYSSSLSILAIQSFILFRRAGIAETFWDVLSLNECNFWSISWSAPASGSLNWDCPTISVNQIRDD